MKKRQKWYKAALHKAEAACVDCKHTIRMEMEPDISVREAIRRDPEFQSLKGVIRSLKAYINFKETNK